MYIFVKVRSGYTSYLRGSQCEFILYSISYNRAINWILFYNNLDVWLWCWKQNKLDKTRDKIFSYDALILLWFFVLF